MARLLALSVLVSGVLLASGCAAPKPATDTPPSASDASPASRSGDLAGARDAHARRELIRGLTRARLGELEAAVHHYERALQAAPEAPAILSALADAQAAQGDVSAALYHAEQARRLAGPDAPAHYYRQTARLHRRNGAPREAAEAYRALLARFPDDRDARLSLARLEAERGRPAQALRAYEHLSGDASLDAEALSEMLSLYRETDDNEGVERTLRALVQRAPQADAHRRALARFYREHDRSAEADALQPRFADASPSDGSPSDGSPDGGDAGPITPAQLTARARALASDDPAAAAQLLERVIQQRPEDANALALLGDLRLEAGAFAEAADLLARSLDADPRAPTRWTRAADAYLQADRPAEAAAVADEGLLLFPGQLPLLSAHAAALEETGQPAEAARRLEEALRVMHADGLLDGGTPTAEHAAQAARFHEALARLYRSQGDTTQADHHRAAARALRQSLSAAAN